MKPQVDWSNPCTKNLAAVWVMTDGGVPRDLLSSERAALDTGTGAIGPLDGVLQARGDGVTGWEGDSAIEDSCAWMKTNGGRGAIVVAGNWTVSGSANVFFWVGDTVQGTHNGAVGVGWQTTDSILLWRNGSLTKAEAASWMPWNRYGVFGWQITNEANPNSQNRYYVDGVERANDQDASMAGYSQVGTTRVRFSGKDDAGADMVAGAGVALVLLYKEDPGKAVMRSVTDNPWQIFKRQPLIGVRRRLPDTRVLNVPQVQVWTRQPQGPVEIDRSNPITEGLVFAGPIGDSAVDAVTGNPGIAINTASSNKAIVQDHGGGFAHESNTLTDGGIRWPNSSAFDQLDGSSQVTIMSFAAIDSIDGNGGLFMLPHSLTGWTAPYMGVGLFRDNTTNQGRLGYNDSGTFRYADSASGFLDLSGGVMHQYVATKSGGSLKFYKDGASFSETTITDASMVLNQRQVHLLSRNNTASDEGTDGRAFLTLVWSRELTAAEIESLNNNPWQIFERGSMQVPIEYEELTFDEEREERLFIIPQKWTRDPE